MVTAKDIRVEETLDDEEDTRAIRASVQVTSVIFLSEQAIADAAVNLIPPAHLFVRRAVWGRLYEDLSQQVEALFAHALMTGRPELVEGFRRLREMLALPAEAPAAGCKPQPNATPSP